MRLSLPKTATPVASWSSVRAFELRQLAQLLADGFDLRDIDRGADRAVFDHGVENLELPPGASCNGNRSFAESLDVAGAMSLTDRIARARGKKLDAGGQHQFLARSIDSADIGGIHPREPADAVPPPERNRNEIGERPQRRHLADDEDRLFLKLGKRAALASQLPQAEHSAATAGAPGRLDQRAARRAQRRLKTFAVAAKLVDRSFERNCAFRLEPIAEAQERGLVDRHADPLGKTAEDLRLGDARLPDDRALIVGIKERRRAVERRVQGGYLFLRCDQALVAARGEIEAERDKRRNGRSRRDRPPDEIVKRAGAKREISGRLRSRRRQQSRCHDQAERGRAPRPPKSTG